MENDGRFMRERMLAGGLYLADDPELGELLLRAADLMAAPHPIDPDLRRAKWEAAKPIAIGHKRVARKRGDRPARSDRRGEHRGRRRRGRHPGPARERRGGG
jgi:hypothetical protein